MTNWTNGGGCGIGGDRSGSNRFISGLIYLVQSAFIFGAGISFKLTNLRPMISLTLGDSVKIFLYLNFSLVFYSLIMTLISFKAAASSSSSLAAKLLKHWNLVVCVEV